MIRVLIVDDEPTIRLGIRNILEDDPELTVVGEAINGENAVELCRKLRPDIVTMDILIPGMSGYEAIHKIMDEAPCPIVVLTSIDSKSILEVSFKALAFGALTVLQKPKSLYPENTEIKHLIEQVKIMAGVKVVRRRLSLDLPSPATVNGKAKDAVPVRHVFPFQMRKKTRLIAIGASTGGPPTLQIILSGLQSNFSLPIVIVQHISHGFISGMADWLSKTTPFLCKVGENGEVVRPGTVYLAPDDAHMIVRDNGLLLLDYSDLIGGYRPSVNALFESVAKNFKAEAIGILLTGMGQDGARGLKVMRQAGAYTIAQDEASSIVFGMPGTAVKMDAVDEVLSLSLIAPWLKGLTEKIND